VPLIHFALLEGRLDGADLITGAGLIRRCFQAIVRLGREGLSPETYLRGRAMRARALFFATSAIALSCLSSTARADVKITVTYTLVGHEVFPENRFVKANVSGEFILTSDHKIHSTVDLGGKSISHTGSLGHTYQRQTSTGQSYNARWSIEKGSIVGHTSGGGSIRISTNSVDSCTALVHTATTNVQNDVRTYDIHAENTSCTISAVHH
jgi:hypothetical protein